MKKATMFSSDYWVRWRRDGVSTVEHYHYRTAALWRIKDLRYQHCQVESNVEIPENHHMFRQPIEHPETFTQATLFEE